MKLTQLMNEGEEKRPLSNEVKKHFLEIVSTYNKYQEMMDRKSDLATVAETLGGITEAARTLAIHEGDDWFDKQTIKRNMSELEKLGKEFDKCAVEATSLDQRLGGLYEDMGNILSRYYKMGDITEEQMKERLGMNESKSDCGCGCGGVTEGGCNTKSVNEGKFKKDDLVYNKRTKTVGIVRLGDDRYGEVKTDADGNVDVDELEKYNPIKNKHQANAKVAPSTEKEVNSRGLFNPFKNESVNEAEYKVGDTISVTLKNKKVIKGKVEKLNPLKVRTGPSDVQVLGNHLIKTVVKESKSSCGCGCGGKTVGGCSTSVNEVLYKDAVVKFNDELIKHPMVKKLAQHYKKTPAEIIKVLQQRLSTKGNRGGDTKEISINFKDNDSGITIKHKTTFNESVNEAKKFGDWSVTREDENQIKLVNQNTMDDLYVHKSNGKFEVSYKKRRIVQPSLKQVMISVLKLGESVVNESPLSKNEKLAKKYSSADAFAMAVAKRFKSKSDVYKNVDKDKEFMDMWRDMWKSANESVKEGDGLWANIRAKQARGEKPANKNSQAHKDAVKAGKKINKEESVNEANFGYKDSTSSYINNHNDEYKQAEKLNKGNEVKFYDTLSQMEEKIGHPKFMIFLSNALRGYKVDMYKDSKIKNPQDAQEALYLLSK